MDATLISKQRIDLVEAGIPSYFVYIPVYFKISDSPVHVAALKSTTSLQPPYNLI